jgi:hypothetical protein
MKNKSSQVYLHYLAGLLFAVSATCNAIDMVNVRPKIAAVAGDRAKFTARFSASSGNDAMGLRALDEQGAVIGTISRNNEDGMMEWSCDTTNLPVGEKIIDLQAVTAGGQIAASVPFSLVLTSATNVEKWRQQFFGASAITASSSETEDPDGDGRSNFEEFAFGLNPNRASDESPVVVSDSSLSGLSGEKGPIRAAFRRRKSYQTDGLDYVVEFSNDLTTWNVASTSPNWVADEGSMEMVETAFPPSATGTSFVRIRVVNQ